MASNRDRVRDLAAAGYTARQIALELGVSRQRVYQIADAEGVSLPRANAPDTPRRGTVPKPRVITGGIEQPINHTTAGTISELLAAADLLARGWQVYMPVVRARGHDLIAVNGGKVVTVEVRSAKRNAEGNLVYNRSARDRSQAYALVLTGEPVQFRPSVEEW